MNINQLKYFVAVAQTKSFTKAGDQYFISQTAITQQIRQLEQSLNCDLIDRSNRPLKLTNAGKTFLNEAQAIIERMDNAIVKTKEAATGMSGVLRIGYLKGYERSDLSNRLAYYHRLYPNILISCYRYSSEELITNLLNDRLDLILSMDANNLKYDPSIDWLEIENVPLVAVLYANHPLANRSSLKREDLQNEILLNMSATMEGNSIVDARYMEMYNKAGYHPNILFSSTDFESLLMMVASEQGITIVPNYCTKKLDNAENLVFIPLIGEKETEDIYCFNKKENSSLIIQKMKDALKGGNYR